MTYMMMMLYYCSGLNRYIMKRCMFTFRHICILIIIIIAVAYALKNSISFTMKSAPSSKSQTMYSMEEFNSIFYKVNVLDEILTSIKGNIFEPLTNYKNPCWVSMIDHIRADEKPFSGQCYNTDGLRWRMRCFPYAMLIGVEKSGTTDLFGKIIRHPQIYSPCLKEISFWNRQRIGQLKFGSAEVPQSKMTFKNFITTFDSAAEAIRKYYTVEDDKEFHPGITLEATPHYLWDYDGWEKIPGNIGLSEPKYILAHSLYALRPQLKFLAILRNPTERLYSQFLQFNDQAHPDVFHFLALKSINLWNECRTRNTERSCAYNATLNPHEFISIMGGMTLRAGMYTIYLEDWFAVYPASQFLIIPAEQYYKDQSNVLHNVFHFLDVEPSSDDGMAFIIKRDNTNSSNAIPTHSKQPMLDETRLVLDEFYRPFNDRLSNLLSDNKFLWQ